MTDTRQVLEEAFAKVFPPPPNAHLGMDIPALEAHTQIARRFRRFLDAEAWMDAAMMLVPEGWHTRLAMQDRHSLRWKWMLRGGYGVDADARAETPALALAQAALRAKEAGDV